MRITDIFDAVRDGTYFDFMDFYSGNPNLFNKYAGMSLLQLSVVNDRYPDEKIKILRFLISEGADVNFLSPKDQRNALHIFYFSVLRPEPQYMLKITQLLIAAGVDINKKDKYGAIPLQYAITAVKPVSYTHLDVYKRQYGSVYMNVLKTFGSADSIAHADIRNIRKCFEANRKGRRISLTPEELKEAARNSIGFPSKAEVIELRHLIDIIELINVQISEVDKKIEEFSVQNNSPILTIPGISHFSGTSILAELGDLRNYSKASQVIKFAGVSPSKYKSSQYEAQHTAITKKGSRYLRKTLYQVILPVIRYNPVFNAFYRHKLSQGKGHRCAQGHCVRKLLRIIYHLVTTDQSFDPKLLR